MVQIEQCDGLHSLFHVVHPQDAGSSAQRQGIDDSGAIEGLIDSDVQWLPYEPLTRQSGQNGQTQHVQLTLMTRHAIVLLHTLAKAIARVEDDVVDMKVAQLFAPHERS